MRFDTVLMVDWSGGNDRGAKPVKDAIWVCLATGGVAETPVYLRNRQVAEDWIIQTLSKLQAEGHRVLVGFDLCFAYPTGLATQLIGSEDTLALWDITHLPRKGTDRKDHGLPEKRAADIAIPGSFSPWQLAGAGAVGGQVIMGLPMLARLRQRFAGSLKVWPFEAPDAQIVLAETYFSTLPDLVTADAHPIRDASQVAVYARAFSNMAPDVLADLMDVRPTAEGWVLGAGQADALRAALAPAPPPLRNDCFAMPQGAHWTPVDAALAHLKSHLSCVTGVQDCAIGDAAGRLLAQDAVAWRAHPPAPNSAVDGYGFAGPAAEGLNRYSLVAGRSAAGAPFGGAVRKGHAIRILTGANLPKGVDTVVLQEDVQADAGAISFYGPLKKGANARDAGEDMQAGQVILTAERKITPADVGMLAAAGIGRVTVRNKLRVGVLSTGDELRDPGDTASDGDIYDANRPMLAVLFDQSGYDIIDLGRAPDDRAVLRDMLDHGAERCDVIITSGGASAGDEDHMSALLENTGSLALWRIAMKPGRPLAMGLWEGTPVFGLPGNPVAAMVCALIFANPALRVMAGGGWSAPQRYMLPAGFTKSKKNGRREYLRARITDGKVEAFPSEGSGRISGLSWATGLVELGDPAQTIHEGDLVPFLPFRNFDA